jgi:hypothetical protein
VDRIPAGKLNGTHDWQLEALGVHQVMHEHPADVWPPSFHPVLGRFDSLLSRSTPVLRSFLKDPQ